MRCSTRRSMKRWRRSSVSFRPRSERAVLLKDVLDYPLTEVADIADSTLGGVKAALHRGRAKLRALKASPALTEFDIDQRRLFEAYAECFNRRDWDALRHLVRADARLEIVGEAEGRMAGLGATYSSNYTALPWEWRLTAGLRGLGTRDRPLAAVWLGVASTYGHQALVAGWPGGSYQGLHPRGLSAELRPNRAGHVTCAPLPIREESRRDRRSVGTPFHPPSPANARGEAP